jgi:hypothetical protein
LFLVRTAGLVELLVLLAARLPATVAWSRSPKDWIQRELARGRRSANPPASRTAASQSAGPAAGAIRFLLISAVKISFSGIHAEVGWRDG